MKPTKLKNPGELRQNRLRRANSPNRVSGKNRYSDGLYAMNIVIMGGACTAELSACKSLDNAVTLSLLFLIVTAGGAFVSRLLPQKLAVHLRSVVTAVSAAAIFLPAVLLVSYLLGEDSVTDLQPYVYLVIINPVLISLGAARFCYESRRAAFIDSLMFSLGFALCALALGIVRDVLVNSNVGWMAFYPGFTLTAAGTTFGGLIILGILTALAKAIFGRRKAPRSAAALPAESGGRASLPQNAAESGGGA